MSENEPTRAIIGCAIEVHRTLGPGLLESVHEECMALELRSRGIEFERQKAVTIEYKGQRLELNLGIDLLVGGKVVVELKSVEALLPIHDAQLLSYLRLTNCAVGLPINFNAHVLRAGIRRKVNNFLPPSASSAPSAPLR